MEARLLAPHLADAELLVDPRILNDSDFRIINEREPWGTALVRGWKDVENRTQPLTLRAFPGWSAILASGANAKGSEVEALKRMLRESGQEAVVPTLPERLGGWGHQDIVGLVRWRATRTPEQILATPPVSVWYETGSGKHGWIVDQAHAFARPVRGVGGCQSATRLLHNLAEPERTRLRDELWERILELSGRE